MCFNFMHVGCTLDSECCRKLTDDVGKVDFAVGEWICVCMAVCVCKYVRQLTPSSYIDISAMLPFPVQTRDAKETS